MPAPSIPSPSTLQEKFEAAVEEYKTALEMLGRLEGGHDAHRRRCVLREC